MIEKVREDAAEGITTVPAAAAKPVELERKKLPEPRLLEFVVDMPSVTAEDLCVQLVVLYTNDQGHLEIDRSIRGSSRPFIPCCPLSA